MAGMKSIDEARDPLEAACLELKTLVAAFSDLADEVEPPWLWLIQRRVDDLHARAYDYIDAVHQHARPLLDDMARLARPS